MSAPIVGIDLGTTNSLVAVASWPSPPDQPRVLAGPGERALLQSIVLYRADGSVLVGDAALGEKDADPGMLVASAKRLMGRSVADASEDAIFRSFEVVEGEGGTARVRLRTGRTVTPQEVSAHVLEALRRRASRALGVEVTRAVITVPAYFDDAQRQATRDAARLAGLEVVRLVAEPTAAALAYGLGLHAVPSRVAQNVVVYDLGGGTFDVSVLRITPASEGAGSGGADAFEVLATHGDTHLGGDDFDHAIVRWIVEQAAALRSELPAPDDSARSRLKSAAEMAKVELSLADSVVIDLAPLLGQGLPAITLSRQTFEGLIWGMVDRTIASCKRALRDASRQMDGEPVGAVVMVGGATRTPLVRRRVAECFGIEPYTAIDPDQAVALGAAVQGAMLSGAGGVGGGPGSLLLDVVPLSLGIETANGAFAKIVMRNTPIPAAGHEMFSTQAENQTSIKLHVLQGEREMAADCRSLGVFHLRGIPPMPAGIPQLRVDFAVDTNGLLTVSALERRSGKRLSVQVVPHHGLSKDEVERIERESFAHARTDMARHRVADLLANSRLDLGWIRRQLDRAGGDMTSPQRDTLQRCMDDLAGLLARAEADWSAADPDEIQQAKEALDRASVPLHESSIRRSLAEDPPGAGRSG